MLNRAEVIGHLGADPETRYLSNGDCVANINVATTEKWRDKASGENREQTEWHRVEFYGKLAEVVAQYLKKGSLVYVAGKITTRKWQDKEGIERYTTSIKASEMKMLGGRGDNSQGGARSEQSHAGGGTVADLTDDIPF